VQRIVARFDHAIAVRGQLRGDLLVLLIDLAVILGLGITTATSENPGEPGPTWSARSLVRPAARS
jgi:hypothetical protein